MVLHLVFKRKDWIFFYFFGFTFGWWGIWRGRVLLCDGVLSCYCAGGDHGQLFAASCGNTSQLWFVALIAFKFLSFSFCSSSLCGIWDSFDVFIVLVLKVLRCVNCESFLLSFMDLMLYK